MKKDKKVIIIRNNLVNHTVGFDNDNLIHYYNWNKTQYHKYWSGKAQKRNWEKICVI